MTATTIDADLSRVLTQAKGLTCDSRKVEAGWLFAALDGETSDGRDYIEQALQRGARAVLVETGSAKPEGLSNDVLWLECAEPRKRYAELAAAWWQKVPQTLVGITGTNGKTSSAFFLQQLWHARGLTSASLGTLGVGRGDEAAHVQAEWGSLTSAEPTALHATLAKLAQEGVSHAAIEASSHGLAQHRLDGLRFRTAILTNLSRDHLDYHKSWEAYRAAKTRLFQELLEDGGWIIAPLDDPFAEELVQQNSKRAKVMRTRIAKGDDDKPHEALTAFVIARKEGRTEFSLRLRCKDFCGDGEIVLEDLAVGFEESFPLHNLLLALAAFITTDKSTPAWDAAWLRETLAGLRMVRGRMECFMHPRLDARVYVDYAHTPAALEAALREGRRVAERQGGRLACVFGCGGERDRDKRGEMGEIAGRFADRIFITDDNPRGEDAAAIRAEIAEPLITTLRTTLRAKGVAFEETAERRLAIEQAVFEMGEGDVVIVAGKGHEQGQIIGKRVRPFDDAAVVRETLALTKAKAKTKAKTKTKTKASEPV